MFLDIHALHTLPYSNVNRDGLGSPKSCIYGGTQRIRVSSQSWKRAARLELERRIDSPTVRTRQIAVEVRTMLVEQGWSPDDARRAGRAVVEAYGLTAEDDTDITKVLLWLPSTVTRDLADLANEHRDLITALPLPELDAGGKPKRLSKAEREAKVTATKAAVSSLARPVTQILNQRSSTIALLGRMLADTPDHTVDGATQVAHAFTVHEAAPDFDYFTAVDDLAPNSGAGHLATAEFASGTFYRYCTVNIAQFVDQLGDFGTALDVIEAWTRTFLTVVPSGKANSTAAHTTPDLVYLAVRTAPMSLAGGFEKPIYTNGDGYLDRAVSTLDNYTQRLHRFLGDQGSWSGHSGTTDIDTNGLGTHYASLADLTAHASEAVCGAMSAKATV
ncbi:type I-E CRISPR-associated protein Cas7/Cse4/CasC [Nocardia rhizosphaerihabitans]|uniref:Type I-E CRISPR-associated protein Cas7/Cse4/CasC n=1 Tax=Nocardia rhizosphaerihabitans TaxID=1691570 RepID=A0ABQ2K360_9NOCA|nr:type I-E CRISPR-associated protein Cas7/Cse4/CasC [Nocardia rhizosphaerihabitans]GGN66276.1 type I-E CRISPR-associated protein Cas7/Cse4/CasC [Nocardia rhizosphaerihabitans]